MVTTDAKFEFFPLLPREIRDEIWRAAWVMTDSPGRDRGTCLLPANCTGARVVYDARHLALLATCREARAIARKAGCRRAYDPKNDVLYIPTAAYDTFVGEICGGEGGAWVSEVRHIAVPLPRTADAFSLAQGLVDLNSLESVSVVYPMNKGLVDCFWDVIVPRKDASLRKLTPEEVESIKIRADYDFDTLAYPGVIGIAWRRTAEEHLDSFYERLSSSSRPSLNGGIAPAMWDYMAHRLNLRLEARYFDDHGLSPLRPRQINPAWREKKGLARYM
ncbi:hypothetical protein GQ53DRAFT_120527 [Thozetella sp. PMI_491]|nr:hypothetical protein GQ53DRAFT_120527 [Thozetella sp. PMI_491]